MEVRQRVDGERPDPARATLAWGFCVTVGSLVLAERFAALLPAMTAFAGAAWVLGLERRLRPASGPRP